MRLPKVVLAGLGARGRTWADVVVRSGLCTLAAYVDMNPEAVQEASERFGTLPIFPSLERAFDALHDVDGVIIATPPTGREDQVRAAWSTEFRS